MQPNKDANPASLIPPAHLATATQNISSRVRGGNTSGQDIALLKNLQSALNSFMGSTSMTEQREDVVIVNPFGRITEISGEHADEYLSKPGFRRATQEEEGNYRKAILRQTPEYLRRLEKKRLQAQKAMLDELEEEDEGADISPEKLLRVKVTDSQRNNAPTPDQVRTRSEDDLKASDDSEDDDMPRPPKRRSKAPSADELEDV